MIRQTLMAAAALTLAAAPVLAQTAPPQQVSGVQPGSEEWLRLRGEMYNRAPDSEQDPAEVAATARLNAEIAARNAAAAEAETGAMAAFEDRNAAWRAETARLETERAQWEANVAAANAAQAQWERERAAWEAEMDACRRSGRVCLTPPPPRY
ncbi:hypothetical protein N0B44_31860 [Roseibacterium beibuensis]|uniref:hypothetical protein n=1 Tax=[Roseibacterium] beibuensis TaxID=1193142 RepID=UPI00217E7824|nr:hypothetical protein [Roseibacterium beibuensis]MCS6627510.1 hypothetical protein [Roseibacterium beibuensis]